jgi:hypothetical protein
MEKSKIFKSVLDNLLNKPISEDMILDYIDDDWGDKVQILQDYVGENFKKEVQWMVGSALMEALDFLYDEAKNNGNFRKKE